MRPHRAHRAALALAVVLAAGPAAARDQPALTTVRQIRDLPTDQARRGLPVRVRVVVTHYSTATNTLFVQDDTGGIYVRGPVLDKPLSRGQEVEITGFVAPGYTPYIDRPVVRTLRQIGLLAPPRPTPLADCARGAADATWVETEGVVRSAAVDDGRAVLQVAADGRHLRVVVNGVSDGGDGLDALVDGRVRFRGVCGVTATGRDFQLQYAQLLVNSPDDYAVVKAAPVDPFAAAATPLNLLPASADRRVKVEGTVTDRAAEGRLTIRAESGAALVRPAGRSAARPGDRVTVLGFPARLDGLPCLDDAQVRSFAPRSGRPSARWPDDFLPVLETVRAVRRLTPTEVGTGYPIRLEAVVTFADADWKLCFVQDATNGIFLESEDWANLASPGQPVAVEGYSDTGQFAPAILGAARPLGPAGPLPYAPVLPGYRLLGGHEDGQWITVEGVVRAAEVFDGHLLLQVGVGGQEIEAVIPGVPDPAVGGRLVDATVRIRGACGTRLDNRRRFLGVRLFTPTPADLVVLRPAPAEPVPSRAADLLRFNPDREAGNRVRVTATATILRHGVFLFVQDDTGGAFAVLDAPAVVRPGDRVEVVGFPSRKGFSPQLDRARVQVLGAGVSPVPSSLEPTQARSGEFDGRLIALEAVLLDQQAGPEDHTLLLEGADGAVFEALVASNTIGPDLTDFPPRSRLRLVGVCTVQADAKGNARGFRLLPRSGADVTVLEPPSRVTRSVLALVAALAAIALASFAGVILLRRRVRQQTDLIRDRLHRETALEARYRDLFASAHDLIFTLDPAGRLTDVNPACERRLGYDRADILGRALAEFAAPEQADRVARALVPNSSQATFELDLRARDGRTVRLEVSTRPLPAGHGPGVQGIARDITARKKAEEELRQAYQILSFHIENTPLAVIEWDREFRVERWSRQAEAMFGWTAEDVLGKHPNEFKLVHPEDRTGVGALMRRLAERAEPRNVSANRNLNKAGTVLYCEWYNSVLLNDSGELVSILSLVLDVTARRRAEQERQQMELQVRQAQKMEAVGRLAGGVAHDFNNLLTVVTGCTDLVLSNLDPSGPDHALLGDVLKAGERAATLTRQLLAFGRKQVVAPTDLNMHDLVTNMLSVLARLVGEAVSVRPRLDPAAGLVRADRGQIEQVLLNLCVNARDAMPAGGVLTLECRGVERPEGPAVLLAVADTGCGMTAEVQARMFEPFFTTKEAGRGTGLGLATVHGIVQQSGGQIEVESRPDAGTVIRVYLPGVDATPTTTPAPAPAVERHGGRGLVLLAEDDDAVRSLAARVLELHGYTVLPAPDAPTALRLAADHAGAIDLLLTDVVMPGLNGRELAERLTAGRPGLPVLYMSGYTGDDVIRHGLESADVRLLNKPFTAAALAQAVADAVASTRVAT